MPCRGPGSGVGCSLWCQGPHLLHRPRGAHGSSASRGSRHSEAWRGPAQGSGGRQSCRWSCVGGRGGSLEGPTSQVSWAQVGLSPDMPSEAPLPATCLPGPEPPEAPQTVSPRMDKITQVCPRGPRPQGQQLRVTAQPTSLPCALASSGSSRLGRRPGYASPGPTWLSLLLFGQGPRPRAEGARQVTGRTEQVPSVC